MTTYYQIRNGKVYIQGIPHEKKDCRRISINGKDVGVDLKEKVNTFAKKYRELGWRVAIRKV